MMLNRKNRFDPRQSPRRGWLLGFFLLLVVVGGIAANYYLRRKSVITPRLPATMQPQKPRAPDIVSLKGRYLFNGTIFWGRRIEQWATRPDGTLDYARPFSGLASFDRESYDAWTGDLECPSSSTVIPIARQETELVFNCRPEFLPEAAKYFNFINLANNHSDNLGPQGLEETRRNLAARQIQSFGHYEPGRLQDTCEVVGIPVRIRKSDESEEKGSLPVAFCAWHYFYRLPQPGELEVLQQYAEIMPVFAFLHMGAEYKPKADALQRQVARRIADLGADMVIANSPHWVQDSEAYKGKLIVYSTGNFIFDQQYNAEVTRSVSVDVTMGLDNGNELKRWLALGPDCAVYKDDCLSKINAQGLQKLRPKFSFAVVAGDNSNKLTKKGSLELQKSIESRLQWEQVLSQLSQ